MLLARRTVSSQEPQLQHLSAWLCTVCGADSWCFKPSSFCLKSPTSQHCIKAQQRCSAKHEGQHCDAPHLCQVVNQVQRPLGRGSAKKVRLQEQEHSVKGEAVNVDAHTGRRVAAVPYRLHSQGERQRRWERQRR